VPLSQPITNVAFCCARAASGQEIAAMLEKRYEIAPFHGATTVTGIVLLPHDLPPLAMACRKLKATGRGSREPRYR
jgi:hypothetical protein